MIGMKIGNIVLQKEIIWAWFFQIFPEFWTEILFSVKKYANGKLEQEKFPSSTHVLLG